MEVHMRVQVRVEVEYDGGRAARTSTYQGDAAWWLCTAHEQLEHVDSEIRRALDRVHLVPYWVDDDL
jgi:hypothetical protein